MSVRKGNTTLATSGTYITGTNDTNNWNTLTIGNNTKALPGNRTLLWTNPDASYATGTVSLDLTSYTHVIVGGYAWQSPGGYTESICPVGSNSLLQYIATSTDSTSSAANFMNTTTRTFSVATTGVTFANGQMTYKGGVYQNWSSRMVPAYIWGVKI